jgi:hypothetical protein
LAFSAFSQTQSHTVTISFSSDRDHQSFLRDAETMAAQAIERELRQNSALDSLEVTVLGERHGEIMPIFSVSVSRDQWQSSPLISAWAEYYSASYALLRRHQDVQTVANAATATAAPATGRRAFISEAAVQRAYDSGRLSGQEAQTFVDDLD